jgi:type VI protein secretion system component VasK
LEHDTLIKNSHNTVKTTWDILNKESGRIKKRNDLQALKVGDRKITDHQSIAETLNAYFVAIAENTDRRITQNTIKDLNDNLDSHAHFMEQAFNKPYPNIECNCITVKEIEQIIQSLKTKRSYGYDEISTKNFKISFPFISSPINFICNKMPVCSQID